MTSIDQICAVVLQSLRSVFTGCREEEEAFRHQLVESGDVRLASMMEIWKVDALSVVTNDNMVRNKFVMLRQRLWEKLHALHWKDTPMVYRMQYAATTHVVVAATFLQNPHRSVDDLLFAGDLGLLLGSPLFASHLHQLIDTISGWQQQQYVPVSATVGLGTVSRVRIPLPKSSATVTSVQVLPQPSVVDFYAHYFLAQSPVILCDCLDGAWPAFSQPDHNWQDINYLLRGKRMLQNSSHCSRSPFC